MSQMMTRGARRPLFLASVRSVDEAVICVERGADLIDCKEPSTGTLGAIDAAAIREIRDAVPAHLPVSATIGDLACEPCAVCERIEAVAAAGADIVKIGLFPGGNVPSTLAAAGQLELGSCRLVAVMFADLGPDYDVHQAVADAGFAGVMLDTAGKDGRSLLDFARLHDLTRFILTSRARGLLVGLAGSLKAGDIAEAVACDPDIIGFRGALCAGGARGKAIDGTRVADVASALALFRPREAGQILDRGRP